MIRAAIVQAVNLQVMGKNVMIAPIEKLTPRELEIIGIIATGQSEKQTAQLLSIRPVTVHKHITNAVEKTGLKNRIRLIVAWARWQTIQELNKYLLDLSR